MNVNSENIPVVWQAIAFSRENPIHKQAHILFQLVMIPYLSSLFQTIGNGTLTETKIESKIVDETV